MTRNTSDTDRPGGEAAPGSALAEPAPEGLEVLSRARQEAQAALDGIATREDWERVRVHLLGRKQGRVRALLAQTGEVPEHQRREFGQAVNELKEWVDRSLAEHDARLTAAEREATRRAAAVDVTLPGRRPALGSLHPVTRVQREVEEIFAELGYSVAEGPEVEDDFHNFQALNFPAEHPARDTQDTFFLRNGLLLRTHTSPVQIRTMLARQPPIRVICPGRVFRADNDLRHSPMFHQVEGLAVAEGITFGHLKGTLEAFLKRLFSPSTGVRLRPSFFPFTEPSVEVDITCPFCKGAGCETCSKTGWMEILGAGMINPRVLANCKIDPEVYTGFAFGLGLDRVAMIRYGIPNIRTLFDNDERLLRQIEG
jgi:phenylalanyl-tRNA synthetase alpha chain